ncbi:MAG TPA: DUF4412 domain-containing protein [Polyangiaceae bacterium]
MRLSSVLLFANCVFACNRSEPAEQSTVAPAPAPAPAASGPPSATTSSAATKTDDDPDAKLRGRARLEVKGARQPLGIVLSARGDRTRIQVQRAAAEPVTALLEDDDRLTLLRDESRQYEVRDLDKLTGRAEREHEVKVERTSEKRTVSGLSCIKWQLSVESQRVDACVHALRAKVDADKLEAALGIDLPNWAERLLEDGYFPVQATVTEGGREAYRVELVEYTAQEPNESELEVPAGYHELGK